MKRLKYSNNKKNGQKYIIVIIVIIKQLSQIVLS